MKKHRKQNRRVIWANPFRILSPGMTVLCLFFLMAFSVANAKELATEGRIADVRAFLYYHESGEFSREDVLPGTLICNRGLEGADVEERPSSAMLVLVRVHLPKSSTIKDKKDVLIRLIVKNGARVLSSQDVSLQRFIIEQPTLELPFMVYNVGWEPLVFTASLEVKGKKLNSVSKRAKILCGE